MDIQHRENSNDKWLNAYSESVACLCTITQCMTLSDIHADGDYKLVVADFGTGTYNMKLKVYKNTSLLSEHDIMDLPTGVVSFYMDTLEPRTPAIAVASGPFIFVYKNLRPYFKFTLPTLSTHSAEQDVWEQARTEQISLLVLKEALASLRSDGISLTVMSQRFLQLDPSEMDGYVQINSFTPLKRQTVITCMATLKKSLSDDDAISCLVLGTESRSIYVLDPESFAILSTMELASVPVFLSVSGLFDVEYCIMTSCRNGHIYTLKRGSTDVVLKDCAEMTSQPVGVERINKNVYIGTMDRMLSCFTARGKKLWALKMPADIITMEVIDLKSKGFKAVAVSLSIGQVRLYREKYLVDVVEAEGVVVGLRFGRFAREDGTLVMVTKAGGLFVKILKRTAKFDEECVTSGLPAVQASKLRLPKKSKLFVDQSLRERENAIAMHRTFQRDLYLLKLRVAREYVKALDSVMIPVSVDSTEPIKLSAQVHGLGPTFKLVVTLQNMSPTSAILSLFIIFQFDSSLYSFQKNYIKVPMMVPGLSYTFDTLMDSVNDNGVSGDVKVFVVKEGKSVPVVSAVISMPISEVAAKL